MHDFFTYLFFSVSSVDTLLTNYKKKYEELKTHCRKCIPTTKNQTLLVKKKNMLAPVLGSLNTSENLNVSCDSNATNSPARVSRYDACNITNKSVDDIAVDSASLVVKAIDDKLNQNSSTPKQIIANAKFKPFIERLDVKTNPAKSNEDALVKTPKANISKSISTQPGLGSNKVNETKSFSFKNPEISFTQNENLPKETAIKPSNQEDKVKSTVTFSKNQVTRNDKDSTAVSATAQSSKQTTEKAGEKEGKQVSATTIESANSVQTSAADNSRRFEKLKQIEDKINYTDFNYVKFEEIKEKIQITKKKMKKNDESSKNQQISTTVPDKNTETNKKDNQKLTSDTNTSTPKQIIANAKFKPFIERLDVKTNPAKSNEDALVKTPKANISKSISTQPGLGSNKVNETKSSNTKKGEPSKKSKSIKKIEMTPNQKVKNTTTEKKSLAASGKNDETNSSRAAIKRRLSNEYSGRESSSKEPPAKKQKGSKICEFFARGYCYRRDECWFTHDLRDKVRSEPKTFKLVADFKMTIHNEKSTVNARIERAPNDEINDLNNARVSIKYRTRGCDSAK